MSRERLEQICKGRLAELGLEAHAGRLAEEIRESVLHGEVDYLLAAHDARAEAHWAENEHNLLVPFLLGICPRPNLDKPQAFTVPEFPDIDIDYLAPLQPYLKNDWAPKVFGADRVSNIGNYSTYGIKASVKDMARVFELDRFEVEAATKKFKMKDDEGETLSWDKAVELYPEFRAWTEKYPEVAEAAHRLMYADIDWSKYGYTGEPPHRNRTTGMHAGGLIISDRPIAENVPLIRGKEGTPATAWAEGQASSDLSIVGLVKYDVLVVDALDKIASCIKLIQRRHRKDVICGVPGGRHWSDLSYRNDKKAIAMANEGDLKGVFQFDSSSIRDLARYGGVTSFEDLVAYTCLHRPGPMDVDMHMAYCRRKRGEEPYEIHPLLEPALGRSYGIMVYQEDVFKVLNLAGDIPLAECQPIIKAISKKKKEKFQKYQEQFIRNAARRLGISLDEAAALWDQIESFGGYGFNRGHAVGYTYLTSRMLYLKANYPIEFYTSIMSCLKTGDDRLKEYRADAEGHGIVVERPHVNLSGEDFEIRDEKIYWGLGKIKGVGEESARRIVAAQPYAGLQDFLDRFGTDGVVLKPVLALGLFDEKPGPEIFQYYLQYKDREDKRRGKATRWRKRREQLLGEIDTLLDMDDHVWPEGEITLEGFRPYLQRAEGMDLFKKFAALQKKFLQAQERAALALDDPTMGVDDYDGDPEKVEDLDKALAAALADRDKGDAMFLGFVWTHPLRRLKGHTGQTFETHKRDCEKYRTSEVEVLVRAAYPCRGKGGKEYLQMEVEDCDGEVQKVNVWQEDMERFRGEFEAGAALRLRLQPPNNGYKSYSLESGPPPWKRKQRGGGSPYGEKQFDYRVVRLGPPEGDK